MRLGADVVLPWDGRDHYLAGIYRTVLPTTWPNWSPRANAACGRLVDTVDTQRIVMPEQAVV